MILVETKDGGAGVGSGVFVSAEGRLLTCYHVIAGAVKIRVVAGDTWTDQVAVEAIAPSRDLATLRVTGLRARPSFIPLATDAPARDLTAATIDVYGYPTAAPDGRAPQRARATSATFVKSGTARHPETRQALFAADDVDLLPLEIPGGRELSGAPVVIDDTVVGLVTGRVVTGAASAWAIPVAYVTELTPLNQRPGQIEAWPPFTLRAPGWPPGGRNPAVGPGLLAALDQVARALDARAALQAEALNELTLLGNQVVERYSRAAELAVFRFGARQRMEELAPDVEAEFLKALGAYGDRAEYYDTRFDDLGPAEAVATLRRELDLYFARLAPSPANAALKARALEQIAHEFDAEDAIQAQLVSRMKVFGQIADSYNSVDTLGDLKRAIERASTAYGALLQETETIRKGLSHLRTASGVIEALFEAR